MAAAACSASGQNAAPTPVPRVAPTAVPLVEPTATPNPIAAPVPAGSDAQVGMRGALPLQGEFVVTANQDDRTLSVVPVGLAKAVATVTLDAAPRSVTTAPGSDTAVTVLDGAALGFASLNGSSVLGDASASAPGVVVVSPPAEDAGPVVLLGADDTLQRIDPNAHTTAHH